nr:TadE family type IV pilus minor pilin [Haloechinothrix alba]
MRSCGSSERGSVTVEAALALASLVAVLVATIAGVAAVTDQLRCTDAAREAARLIARGQAERADEAVSRIAPADARWEVDETTNGIAVTVSVVPAGGLLPGVIVRGDAFAVPEPVAAPPGERQGGAP